MFTFNQCRIIMQCVTSVFKSRTLFFKCVKFKGRFWWPFTRSNSTEEIFSDAWNKVSRNLPLNIQLPAKMLTSFLLTISNCDEKPKFFCTAGITGFPKRNICRFPFPQRYKTRNSWRFPGSIKCGQEVMWAWYCFAGGARASWRDHRDYPERGGYSGYKPPAGFESRERYRSGRSTGSWDENDPGKAEKAVQFAVKQN